MSHASFGSKSGLLGAATVLVATALLSAPTLAGARPPVPLSPACDQFQFIGDYSLRQANGFTVQFRSTGPNAGGSASALDSSGKTAMTGTVSGGINRTRIDFTIRWSSGPRGHYTGLINADGFASGTTVDEANPGPITNWGATVPLGCATPAPTGPRPGPNNGPILAPDDPPKAPSPLPTPRAQPPLPTPQAQPPTVTVSGDVDVYSSPDGDHGKKLGILRKGGQVQVLDRQNGFAHVKGQCGAHRHRLRLGRLHPERMMPSFSAIACCPRPTSFVAQRRERNGTAIFGSDFRSEVTLAGPRKHCS